MSAEFAGSLRERIAIERPATVRTAGGLQTAGWEPVAECLAAIVPEGAGAEAEAMSLSAMPRFRVTIRARHGIAVGQRVRWGERLLAVRQMIEDPRLADRLMLRCEEVR
jgi:head-tail adaptor